MWKSLFYYIFFFFHFCLFCSYMFNFFFFFTHLFLYLYEYISTQSTIISLLERFYDPQSGTVNFDRTPNQQLHLTSYRHLLGYVGQEPILFNCSIRENIAYGLLNPEDYINSDKDSIGETIPMQAIIDVAKAANIHDFIMSLPDGYETMAGEKGSKLSGMCLVYSRFR